MSALEELRTGGKPALARALAAIESAPEGEATLALLEQVWASPRGRVVGLTGPPGVGKSTLASTLVVRWRAQGRSVGVIAVDPSSRRTGGAILGDRTRITTAPEDDGVFVRSLAARGRLGGLAEPCAAAMVLMRALFDLVLVETVGVGQSETEIAQLVDTVVLAVQPGSGDSLQYMKAGIAEIPDVAVITKADLGALAARTQSDLAAALRLGGTSGGWEVPVLLVSASTGEGVPELVAALERHAAHLEEQGDLADRRHTQGQRWLERWIEEDLGRLGLADARPLLDRAHPAPPPTPFHRHRRIVEALRSGR